MDSHTFRITDNCDSVNVACCYVYVPDFSWPNGYFSALGQHTHILTGFAAAKVNIKINPSNRCPLHWASFSARMKHKMRGSQHPGKAWPMKIKVTSSSIILGDVTYPHRVSCLWKYLLPRTDPERYCHWFKKKYKLREKKMLLSSAYGYALKKL